MVNMNKIIVITQQLDHLCKRVGRIIFNQPKNVNNKSINKIILMGTINYKDQQIIKYNKPRAINRLKPQ